MISATSACSRISPSAVTADVHTLAGSRAIALVSHDVEFVALCADSVLLLGEGEVVVSGPTGEVLGDSLLFSTQVGKLFPGSGWLTVADVERAVAARGPALPAAAGQEG